MGKTLIKRKTKYKINEYRERHVVLRFSIHRKMFPGHR